MQPVAQPPFLSSHMGNSFGLAVHSPHPAASLCRKGAGASLYPLTFIYKNRPWSSRGREGTGALNSGTEAPEGPVWPQGGASQLIPGAAGGSTEVTASLGLEKGMQWRDFLKSVNQIAWFPTELC